MGKERDAREPLALPLFIARCPGRQSLVPYQCCTLLFNFETERVTGTENKQVVARREGD